MKEYDIPVKLLVSGMVKGIKADNLEEAIRIAESGKCFVTLDLKQYIKEKPQVIFESVAELYPDEPLLDEPPKPCPMADEVTCPDCNGKLGQHYLSCSIWGKLP